MGEWRSGRVVLSNIGYRCAVFWYVPGVGWTEPHHCEHVHTTAEAAATCAQQEADRRNELEGGGYDDQGSARHDGQDV
jgi:hypothetical protein